ncbi:hypothetical protein QQP08_006385 [Theobroma cacao]|nr:hypothetical protein QQP08_006385 [Theobroma cacao]
MQPRLEPKAKTIRWLLGLPEEYLSEEENSLALDLVASALWDASHFSASPSPSSMRTTSDILGPCQLASQVSFLGEFFLPAYNNNNQSSMAPFWLAVFPNSRALSPDISSSRRIPNPKTSVFSEDWPVDRYSGAICPTVPLTAVVTWESR